eukprot:9155393-Alexandrium_andersonii.AAC.1
MCSCFAICALSMRTDHAGHLAPPARGALLPRFSVVLLAPERPSVFFSGCTVAALVRCWSCALTRQVVGGGGFGLARIV